MSCANADTVKAVTVTIKRNSRCFSIEVMVRRKPQRTGNVFMFPLRDFSTASRYLPTDVHDSAGERHFFQATLTLKSQISLRQPRYAVNKSADGRWKVASLYESVAHFTVLSSAARDPATRTGR